MVIKEIRPLCATDKVCDGKLTCECKNLKPGEDAYFSVVLENLRRKTANEVGDSAVRDQNTPPPPADAGCAQMIWTHSRRRRHDPRPHRRVATATKGGDTPVALQEHAHSKAALIVNPSGDTVVIWVTN